MSFTITTEYEGGCAHDESITVEHMPLYGIERVAGIDDSLPGDKRASGARFQTRFRLLDDDGELCYEGMLDDDEDCANQTAALRWGETMAGATTILVRRGPKWVQEIG